MSFILQFFPAFALAILVLAFNFDNSAKPVINKTVAFLAYGYLLVCIVVLILLLFDSPLIYLGLSEEQNRDIRLLRGHYIFGFITMGMLIRLKGKFLASDKD